MPDQSPQPISFDTAVVTVLACPACHGDLRLEAERLICAGCGRAYPVVDGIPVLIVEHADKKL
jgi:uncharacterized protein YbaR (Trm112 family)